MITYPKDKLQKVILGGGCVQRNLPSEYTQVAYLESTGTQYIDTGVVPKTTLSIKIKYNILLLTEQNNIAIFGSISNQVGLFSGAAGAQPVYYINNGGNASPNIPYASNTIQEEEYINNTMIRSGVTYTTNPIVENNIPITLFGRNTGTEIQRIGTLRIYYFTLYDNGVLIQNLVPARRNSDNVLGMYDTVSGNFLTNAGTGTFTAGADAVPTPDNPIDIVCNNGVLKASKNLFDETWEQGAITYTQGLSYSNVKISMSTRIRTVNEIYLDPTKTYTISINNSNLEFCIQVFNSQDLLYTITDVSNVWGTSSKTFTGAYGVAVALRYKNSIDILPTEGQNSNIQLEFGSIATPYMPYGIYADGIQEVVTDNLGNTANAEMLLDVDNYTDKQSVLDGVVTKNVGIKVLDGTEDWSLTGTSFRFDGDVSFAQPNTCLCTHFEGWLSSDSINVMPDLSIKAGHPTNTYRVYLEYNRFTTIAQLTSWLADQYNAGTPVIIVYPLETPTTEQVTPQPLAGNSVTQTSGSIDNLPIESSTILKLKKRYIGDNEVKKVYIGDNEVKKVYIGDNLVWESN